MSSKRIGVIGVAAGGVLALSVAGGVWASTPDGSSGGDHSTSSTKSTHSKVIEPTVEHPAMVEQDTPADHASTITLRLKDNPHPTKAFVETMKGHDLGKQVTLQPGESSTDLAKNVPAGTAYKLVLSPGSSADHYKVKGALQSH